MDIVSTYVTLTPADAADVIKRGINAQLVHEERHFIGDKGLVVLVFEKFYFRNSSTAGLTVTIHDDSGTTEVTSIASAGGQGLLNISWGANASFANQVLRVLEPYRK